MNLVRYIAYSFAVIGVLYFCSGCEVKLEREGIPLWLGIQLETDTSCSADSWLANQQLNEQYQPQGWTLEIPIFLPENDSSPFRIPSTSEILFSFDRLKSLSSQSCLHFSMQNPFRLRTDQITLEGYTSTIDSVLHTLASSPDKIMLSGFWVQDAIFQEKLLTRFPDWKKRHPASRFYLAARHTTLLSQAIDWTGSYELAIINDAPPDEMYKAHFRQVNRALSAKAFEYNKTLFIAQTNILGDNKLLLYKNQLRFWDDAVQVEGLIINSLYCQSSLADSTTRFGLARDKELLEYLSGERD